MPIGGPPGRCSSWQRIGRTFLLASALGAAYPGACALSDENDPRDQANGVLGLMSFVVIPDPTTSFVTVQKAAGADDLRVIQIGGSTYWSEGFPLYIEGYIGHSRYRPRFTFDTGSDMTEVKAHWTTWAGTAGIGWDFQLANDLVLRPIANFSIGQITSDASVPAIVFASGFSSDASFLEDGRMHAVGLGGSLMLDFERRRKEYELDAELRYTAIRLETLGGTSSAAKGRANASTVSLWARLRLPTGHHVFERPLRYVLDGAHSRFLGDQANALGPSYISQIGAGLELEASTLGIGVDRARLIARYIFGGDLTGASISFGLSF